MCCQTPAHPSSRLSSAKISAMLWPGTGAVLASRGPDLEPSLGVPSVDGLVGGSLYRGAGGAMPFDAFGPPAAARFYRTSPHEAHGAHEALNIQKHYKVLP